MRAVDPELGLPMSACGRNLPVEGEDPVLKVRTVRLTRAVSRLRFVFCRTRTEGDEEETVAINRVILGGYQIPFKEYVFTTASSGVVKDGADLADNYCGTSYILPGPAEIAENETPENLIYVNQDPVTYEKLIDDAVRENTLTDLGQTYFRESDRRLTGHIEYTVNGRERVREFNMASAGDFARNHTWTVFGYFLSGRNLQLALNVLPWDYNAYPGRSAADHPGQALRQWFGRGRGSDRRRERDHGLGARHGLRHHPVRHAVESARIRSGLAADGGLLR